MRLDRNEYIGFYVTAEEKNQIRNNAIESKETMSSFLRKRGLQDEGTNDEIAQKITNFIEEEVVSREKKIESCACQRAPRSTVPLTSLSPPPPPPSPDSQLDWTPRRPAQHSNLTMQCRPVESSSESGFGAVLCELKEKIRSGQIELIE